MKKRYRMVVVHDKTKIEEMKTKISSTVPDIIDDKIIEGCALYLENKSKSICSIIRSYRNIGDFERITDDLSLFQTYGNPEYVFSIKIVLFY